MKIIRSTREKVAVIELSEEQKVRISQIEPETFVERGKLPRGIQLKIAKGESLEDWARTAVIGNTLHLK